MFGKSRIYARKTHPSILKYYLMETVMIKKLTKLFSVILAVMLVFTCVACDGCDEGGSVEVSLTSPGAVKTATNGGAVVETEKYFYFVNGVTASNADNDYGTPVKGSIMVVDKANFSKQEIVVPKIVSSEDMNAGIYVFGDNIYYGTTTTKKDTNGDIAYGTLEFQKAKLNGDGVEEIALVEGLNTEFRFVEKSGVVYLVYAVATTTDNVVTTDIYCLNTSNGESKQIVDDAASCMFVDNANASKAVVLFTKTVKDSVTDQALSYNEVYAYVAGDTDAKKVLTGKKDSKTGLVSDVMLAVSYIKNGYVFVTVPALSTLTEQTVVAYTFEELFSSADQKDKGTVIVNTTSYQHAYFTTLDGDSYYAYSDDTYSGIAKGSLLSEDFVLVSDIAIAKVIGVYDGYVYYLDSENYLYCVKANAETPEEKIQIALGAVNTAWYAPEITNGWLFYTDASETGNDYLKAVKLDGLDLAGDDVEQEEETELWLLKQSNIKALGKYTDADIAAVFSAKLVEFQGKAYDANMRVDVREDDGTLIKVDGKVVHKDFPAVEQAYNALTDGQKDYLSDEIKNAYSLFIRCQEVNNILAPLEGFNEDDTKTDAEWKTKVETAKNALNKFMVDNADFESVFNMVDNNLLWEYFGNSKVEGALDWLNNK